MTKITRQQLVFGVASRFTDCFARFFYILARPLNRGAADTEQTDGQKKKTPQYS